MRGWRRWLAGRSLATLVLLAALAGAAPVPPLVVAQEAHHPREAEHLRGWLRMEIPGFRIIYRQEDNATARRVAAMADRVMELGSTYMGYTPREVVPVVIYGDTAEANGFFSPYPPHIALFVSSPSGPWMGAGSDWIETVFLHELIHYLHLTQPIGFFGTASRVFGPLTAAASMLFLPGWALEGPTVHGETALIPGGRGENPFFEIQHAAPVLEDRMYSYDQAGFSSAFAPRGRFYASGYLIVDYLLREYGEDAFRELNRTYQRWPMLGMRRALRRTTGMRADQFWDAVVADLQERWAYRRDLPLGAPLTPEEPGDWYLPVHTDRGLITVARGPRQLMGFYRQNSTGGWELLAPAGPIDESSWTVDRSGRTAVIAQYQPDITGDGAALMGMGASFSDLWEIALPEAPTRTGAPPRARRITRGQRLHHPALSPDGTELVAVQRQGSFSRVVTVDRRTGEITPLVEQDDTTYFTPSFSPDGTLLAVTALHQRVQRIVLVGMADAPGAPRGEVLAEGPHLPQDAEVHMPRLVAPRQHRPEDDGVLWHLWYGGARIARRESQLLGLYRSAVAGGEAGASGVAGTGGVAGGGTGAVAGSGALEIRSPELMVEDRIAAFGGFPAADGAAVIYGSYSSHGYTVRHTPAAPGMAVDVAAGGGGAPNPSATAGAPPGAPPTAPPAAAPAAPPLRYRDIPRPVLWLPLAAFSTGGDSETQADIGALLIAASNLGRHTINAQVLYNPWAGHPSGWVTYSWNPGATVWDVGATQEYLRENGATSATSALSLGVFRPVWFEARPSLQRSVALSGSLEYRNTRAAPGDRTLPQLLESTTAPGNTIVRERTIATAGLSVNRTLGWSPRDVLAPPGRRATAFLEVVPPVGTENRWITEATVATQARWAPWRARRGYAGGIQFVPTAVATASTAGAALGRLPYRSGGFDDRRTLGTAARPAATTEETAWLGRLEARIPLGLADAAWRGLALTAGALAVYAEQGGAATAVTASTVAGVELTSEVFFNLLPVTATVGAAFRLPHPGSATTHDWQLYVALGGPAAGVMGRGAPRGTAPGDRHSGAAATHGARGSQSSSLKRPTSW